MGYWGWRQMFSFCVSVLVVGCSTTQDAASTIAPTLLPPVTLIARARITPTPPLLLSIPESPTESSATPVVYTIQRGDTLLGIASHFGIQLEALKAANDNLNPLTLPIGATLVIPHPHFNAQGQPILPTHTPVALSLSAPLCYPTTTGSILCMGSVTNTTSSPIGRVNVDVRLFHRDNSLLDEGIAGVEQSMIPAGAAAPYSLLFRAEWSGYGGVRVSLSSADLALADGQPVIELPIRNQHHSFQRGVYEVIATLHNPGNKTARLTRAVLTLWNANGYLTGYRVMTLNGQVEVGGTISLHINAVAQHGVPYRHNLFVEAEGTD